MNQIQRAAQYYVRQEVKGMIDHNINAGDMARAFMAGSEWQKQKSIEAFRLMGERTRFDIPTDVLIKAREIFIEELNK